MKSPTARTVDEYISKAPERFQSSLQHLRRAIRSAAPEAQEIIAWRMPCYRQNGMLVFFAAFKSHMSFFPASKTIVPKFKNRLKGYEISGTTIHFTPEKPLPPDLVKQIVKARVKENEARIKRKAK
ncbi:MAG: DUF1801 domain-containing protein [Thermoplasmata archaeon]|nr:DUF1801 domain-containing protein [Thermoplasmata archaeon]